MSLKMKPNHSIRVITGLVIERLPVFAPMTCLFFSRSGGSAERTVLPAKKVARDPRGEGLNENSTRWEKTRGKADEDLHARVQ